MSLLEWRILIHNLKEAWEDVHFYFTSLSLFHSSWFIWCISLILIFSIAISLFYNTQSLSLPHTHFFLHSSHTQASKQFVSQSLSFSSGQMRACFNLQPPLCIEQIVIETEQRIFYQSTLHKTLKAADGVRRGTSKKNCHWNFKFDWLILAQY